MPTPAPNWLPTTRSQSILVYSLNVLLLFNVTVILVLLSGTAESVGKSDAFAADRPANQHRTEPNAYRHEGQTHAAPSASQVNAEPSAIPPRVASPSASIAENRTEPFVANHASPQLDPVAADPTDPPAPTEDAPVTFFGVAVD